MTASADTMFLEALEALAKALVELEAPARLIGGVAAIAHGVPRGTVDIDAAVWAALRRAGVS